MKKWAYVEQGIISETFDDLPQNWRNISNFYALSSETEHLRELGWYAIEDRTPPHDDGTQMVIDVAYEMVDGTVIGTGNVVPKPAASNKPTEIIGGYSIEILDPLYQTMDYSARKAIFMTLLRADRDRRITACDWTQLTDILLIRTNTWLQAWRAYRQELRDLPALYVTNEITDINGVIWPIQPPSTNIPDPVAPPEDNIPVDHNVDTGVVTAPPADPEPQPESPVPTGGLNMLGPVPSQDSPVDASTTDAPVDASTTDAPVDTSTTDQSGVIPADTTSQQNDQPA